MSTFSEEAFIFEYNQENYILDPYSQMFWKIENKSTINYKDIKEKIQILSKYGFIKAKQKREKKKAFAKQDITQLVINPSTICNLDCWYCYSRENRRENSSEMKLNEIKQIIRKFTELKKGNKSSTPLGISLYYTSEITQHFDRFLEIKLYIESIKDQYNFPLFLFPSSSNLISISKEFIDFINSYGFLAVSLDLENKEQIETVLQNIKKFDASVRKHCIIPLSSNMKNLYNIYSMFEKDFDYISMRPVRIAKYVEFPWTSKTLLDFEEEFRLFINKLLELDEEKVVQFLLTLGPSDYFARYLNRIISRKKYFTRCPAGKEAVAISSDSKIYPCSGLIGKDNYVINDLNEISDNIIMSNSECEKCPIRFFCGGPCEDWNSKENSENDSSVNQTECSINFIYFKSCTYLISKLLDRNPEIIRNYSKEKGIEFRLSYPLNFDDFVLFFS